MYHYHSKENDHKNADIIKYPKYIEWVIWVLHAKAAWQDFVLYIPLKYKFALGLWDFFKLQTILYIQMTVLTGNSSHTIFKAFFKYSNLLTRWPEFCDSHCYCHCIIIAIAIDVFTDIAGAVTRHTYCTLSLPLHFIPINIAIEILLLTLSLHIIPIAMDIAILIAWLLLHSRAIAMNIAFTIARQKFAIVIAFSLTCHM